MEIPALNVNMIVGAIIVALGLYGMVAGKQRLRILILSVYVGIVFADQFQGAVAPRLTMLSADQVSWLLLGLPIVTFGFAGIMHHKDHPKGVGVANIIVGMCTGALIVSSALHALPTSSMAAIDDASFLATVLQQFHPWILGLLPVVAVVLGLVKGEKPARR